MFCPNCSNDKFRIIDVKREQKYKPQKGWVYDPNTDTRKILCLKCNTIYLTETHICFKEQYEATKNKIKIMETQ